MRVGIIEPHLMRFGGIRRMLELANGLVDRGHDVRFLLPEQELLRCRWMECRAEITTVESSLGATFDVLIANEETQAHLLGMIDAKVRIFYYLHFGLAYDKPGSWEALRVPANLTLANSGWTRDRVAEASGRTPRVLLGGVNRSMFHPVDVPVRYPILCVGDDRSWKGTDVIQAAGAKAGLHVETYKDKNLRQGAMAAEICSASLFVVGSESEGFCQPGLEALACGVPLVTTDNGGCREYAFHEETALVVPPNDVDAMAAAIVRLHGDRALAAELRQNGLDLVDREFSWERAAGRLEAILEDALDHTPPLETPNMTLPNVNVTDPELSIVVLAWDQLDLTQRCVQSIRSRTDVPYELIIVDNGSAAPAAAYADQAADVSILNPENLGFSAGMNQGLAVARGRRVAFLNNDTQVPEQWASRLVEHFGNTPDTGIVVPAVTAAGNARTVRSEPSDRVSVIAPFEAPPSAVLYVMDTATARELGGWGEEYRIASAEDVDLCFKVWTNGLDIVFDERVLLEHVSKGTAGSKLDDWQALWKANRAVFLDKWTGDPSVPRLARVSEEDFQRNLAIAKSVAGWMRRYFAVQRAVPAYPRQAILRVLRPVAARASRFLRQRRDNPHLRRVLKSLRTSPKFERIRRLVE